MASRLSKLFERPFTTNTFWTEHSRFDLKLTSASHTTSSGLWSGPYMVSADLDKVGRIFSDQIPKLRSLQCRCQFWKQRLITVIQFDIPRVWVLSYCIQVSSVKVELFFGTLCFLTLFCVTIVLERQHFAQWLQISFLAGYCCNGWGSLPHGLHFPILILSRLLERLVEAFLFWLSMLDQIQLGFLSRGQDNPLFLNSSSLSN